MRNCFQDFEEIVFLIIAFVVCDQLGNIRYCVFKDCDLGKNSQSAIFRITFKTCHTVFCTHVHLA